MVGGLIDRAYHCYCFQSNSPGFFLSFFRLMKNLTSKLMKFLDGLKALLWSAVGGSFFCFNRYCRRCWNSRPVCLSHQRASLYSSWSGFNSSNTSGRSRGITGFDLRSQVKLRRLSAGVAQNERNDFFLFLLRRLLRPCDKKSGNGICLPFFCSRWRRTSCNNELFANLAIWNANHVGTEQLAKEEPRS